jgi:hypothetical protein
MVLTAAPWTAATGHRPDRAPSDRRIEDSSQTDGDRGGGGAGAVGSRSRRLDRVGDGAHQCGDGGVSHRVQHPVSNRDAISFRHTICPRWQLPQHWPEQLGSKLIGDDLKRSELGGRAGGRARRLARPLGPAFTCPAPDRAERRHWATAPVRPDCQLSSASALARRRQQSARGCGGSGCRR